MLICMIRKLGSLDLVRNDASPRVCLGTDALVGSRRLKLRVLVLKESKEGIWDNPKKSRLLLIWHCGPGLRSVACYNTVR